MRIWTVLCAWVLWWCPFVAAQAAPPPNIVFILGDDQAWTDFGFMGNTEIHTPNLDRLAQGGVVFPRSYVPTSLCRPSLATLMTGLYPHEHRISGNDPPKGIDRAEILRHIQRLPAVPKLLGTAGYRSLQTGKWWEGAPALGGFTTAMSHGDPTRGGRHGDEGLKIGRQTMAPIREFLDQPSEQPFFLWYAPMLPHQPHNPPERLLSKYRQEDRPITIARYSAMCELFDETVGELLGMLESRKLLDSTLIVFTTDNGWIQDPAAPKFAPRSKRSPYEGGIRNPVILHWPAQLKPARIEGLQSSIDIATTILSAAGVQPTAEMRGVDLVAVAKSQLPSRDAVFGEIYAHDIADIERPAASLEHRWVVTNPWKLIVPVDVVAPVELYDLSRDPHERQNVAQQHPEIVTRLRSQLDAWWNGRD